MQDMIDHSTNSREVGAATKRKEKLQKQLKECRNYDEKIGHLVLARTELDLDDRMTLMYAKGVRYYEDEPVADATIQDLDMDFVRSYCNRIGYSKSPEEYVRENKKFVTVKDGKDQISVAAILLFGKNPQLYFPRAFIRFIRYDGVEAKVGRDMNVVKDVIFEGRILEQVEKAVDFIKIQMKEKTYLGSNGIFVTEEEYSEFVRTEIVVNAATHRDYGIKGTDIQIKMFDDRLEVDSPGNFAGMVKKENIRYTHFSRNPKIAAFLKDYGYVKEYGEGVDRMCKELEAVGLPDPVYDNNTFILKTTVNSASYKAQSATFASIQPNGASIEGQNASIQSNDASIEEQNVGVQPNDASIQWKDVLLEKLHEKEVAEELSQKEVVDIETAINNIEIMQVITSKEIMQILSCKTTKARYILKLMETNDIIIPIKGKGKGKYLLNP